MALIEINETVYLTSIIFSIISGILIILLLAIQSFVLVKLMPLIRTTANNSTMFTDAMTPMGKLLPNVEKSVYPKELTKLNINNCQHHREFLHIHTTDCV